MAETVYRGQITLINVDDGTPGKDGKDGSVIVSSKMYYVLSQDGKAPPELIHEQRLVVLEDSRNLTFSGDIATFQVIDGILWAKYNDELIKLDIEEELITGLEGWSPNIPDIIPGWYLWIKTIQTYSDGQEFISYSVSRDGVDGKQGEQGEPGRDAQAFRFDLSQTEILKFDKNFINNTLEDELQIDISPKILTGIIKRKNPTAEKGEEKISNIIKDNLNIEIYDIGSGIWYPIRAREYINLNIDGLIEVDLEGLIQVGKNELDYSEDGFRYPAELILRTEECILKIEYIFSEEEDGEIKKYYISDFINVRRAMNKDMAQLSVKANEIVAAMQDSKMVFGAQGLTVQNGSFVIERIVENESGQQVEKILYADETTGNLIIKGDIYANNGYFRGEIEATSGTFSGELKAATGTFSGKLEAATGNFSGDISAATGQIGGFNIGQNKLISVHQLDGKNSIELDGINGTIIAENITLGANASIAGVVKIGEAVQIKNATGEESFISVKGQDEKEVLSLTANGKFKLGYDDNIIVFDGQNGSIESINSTNNYLRWKLSSKESIFNDVVVQGSIKAAVLEYGEIQAVGGMIIARPSSKIASVEYDQEENTTTFLLESASAGFKEGDWCRIDSGINGHEWYQIIGLVQQNSDEIKDGELPKVSSIIVEGEVSEDHIGKPIVNFGRDGDVGIGLNGSLHGGLITPQSISVFEFIEEDKRPNSRIILGKLPDSSTYGYARNTYGLYAENVLLKGSLVTETADGVYSGINTLYKESELIPISSKLVEKFGERNPPIEFTPSEILLWAGASSDSKDAIENSTFFVDKKGNMYAGSGYFEGTIITNSEIRASDIYTTTIHGTGRDKNKIAALTIKDATEGILFCSNNEEEVYLKVDNDRIDMNVNKIQLNTNTRIGSNGQLAVQNAYISKFGTSTAIKLEFNKIGYLDDFEETEETIVDKELIRYIDFSNGFSFIDGETNYINLINKQTILGTALKINQSVWYGELMEYRPVKNNSDILIGYDLYIK